MKILLKINQMLKQFNFINRWKYQSFKGFESQFGVQVLNEERRGGQITDVTLEFCTVIILTK